MSSCGCHKGARCLDCILADGLTRAKGVCTCDPEFVDVAADVDCPEHGLEATLRREAA